MDGFVSFQRYLVGNSAVLVDESTCYFKIMTQAIRRVMDDNDESSINLLVFRVVR